MGQGMARKAGATKDTIAAANDKIEKEVARRKRTVRSFQIIHEMNASHKR